MTKFLHKINKHENYSNNVNKDHKFNITLCEDEYHLHYDKYVPETRVVTKYNITSTSEPTVLRANYENNIFKSMEIDGVMLDELVTEYTFDTTGVHTVKYELYDETKLGNNAPVFYNSNLVKCIIPDSVTSIGNNAFMNCSNLTSIDIPNSVISIGTVVFANCTSITSINMPNSITSISTGTFNNCTSLTSIDIPDSVTDIGSNAFAGCTGLTSIDIPDSVTDIGSNAFANCSSLISITVNATTPLALNSNVFSNTNNCPIYVPSESVDTYKSNDFWYNYIDRIQAIS